MTINQLESAIKGPDDLIHARVGTISNATSEAYLKQHEIGYKCYATPADGLKNLVTGELDAFVYDAPMIQYWAHQNFPNDVIVLPVLFEKQNYGIALSAGSPLRKPINQEILQKLKSNEWQELLQKYLGEQY